MKKIILLVLVIMFAASAANAQITKASLWAPTSDNTNYFIYGGNYKNTVQAGVTITQLHQGWADVAKLPTPAVGDYKFPHWSLLWHFNDLKDNKNNLDPADDVVTTYFKLASIMEGDSLCWTAHATDPQAPLVKTVAASHVPTRNGIFFAGLDAEGGKHAQGVVSGKDWLRLQTYQGGGNALLVETVNDFLELLSCGKKIVERSRSGSDPDYTYSATTLVESFSVQDSVAVFAVKVADNDNVLAFYPGKFDKTDLRLAFQFDSSHVSSDITLKLLQVSKGTSGKKMTYKMVVSLIPPMSGGAYGFKNIGSSLFVTDTGCDKIDSTSYGDAGPERYVIENIFAAEGGTANMTSATTINVADLIKTKNPSFTSADFSKKRITVAIIGEAEAAAPAGTYHPIIALDDIQVSYWIDWYKAANSGLEENGGNPPTGIRNVTLSSTKVIGKTGQIEITGAQAAGALYNITGQKVANFIPASGSQYISVPKGIYIVVEKNQPAIKVLVK